MRRPRAKTLRLAAVVAASTATAACGISSAATTNSLTSGPTGSPITIGISLPLGGPAQAQGFQADGIACRQGYELWASDVNSHGGLHGHPVRLTILDDKGQPNIVEANYKTLITQDHVDLVMAPFSSLLTISAAQETEKYRYVLTAGEAGSPAVYAVNDPYLFSTNVPVTAQFIPFADWVLSLPNRPTTAAYPMVNDPFADPPVLYTEGRFTRAGIKNVYPSVKNKQGGGWIAPTVHQLEGYARQIVAKAPDIVVLGSVDPPTVNAFASVFRRYHYTPKIFIASAGPDQGQAFLNTVGTGNALGFMVSNGWYGNLANALSHVMVQSYIARYGGTASDINADVAESYSAGETLAAGVDAVGVASNGSVNQIALASWLHSHEVQTVIGPVKFPKVGGKFNGENTLAALSAVIFQWQASPSGAGAPQFVQVLGKAGTNVKPLYPKPPWS
jgi:branched-chain amino acid transport system substrate-binding protein